MSIEANAIIPFGKYKGQPLEVVQATDPQYVQWIATQQWFTEKFANLVAIIRGTASSSESETPEHNAMQIKFVNEEYRTIVARNLLHVFEVPYQNVVQIAYRFEEVTDVRLDVAVNPPGLMYVGIELKPVIGDDFPAVLRQVHRQRDGCIRRGPAYFVVLCGSFSAVSASFEDVQTMFRQSDVYLLPASMMDRCMVPPSRPPVRNAKPKAANAPV
jgi:uncharacterized protein (DUF3820 family)